MSKKSDFQLGQYLPNFQGMSPKTVLDNLEASCYGK